MERDVHGVTANSKVHPRRQESPSTAQETNSRGRGFVQHPKINPNPIFFQWAAPPAGPAANRFGTPGNR